MEQEHKDKIAWLWRYRQALLDERRLRDRIKTARSRAESTTQALRPVSGGGGSRADKVADGAALIEAYQARLVAQLHESERIRREIESAINALPDPMQRAVLQARYIDGLHYWQAANQLYISERHARRLHRAAVENLQTCPPMSAFQE